MAVNFLEFRVVQYYVKWKTHGKIVGAKKLFQNNHKTNLGFWENWCVHMCQRRCWPETFKKIINRMVIFVKDEHLAYSLQ